MAAMVLVREITADDWELVRDVRLAALSEAPYAFSSTYSREAEFTQERWRGRINERSVTFFAHADSAGAAGQAAGVTPQANGLAGQANAVAGQAGLAGSGGVAGPGGPAGAPAGLAGIYIEDGAADLVSMWVRPAARGLGVGEALVEAAAFWAREHGYRALFLWVTESNRPARSLYERCGFTPTGERQPLPSDPTLPEIRLSRPL
jgi:ribosomal protein S18 acetylase RimI-like enzyme